MHRIQIVQGSNVDCLTGRIVQMTNCNPDHLAQWHCSCSICIAGFFLHLCYETSHASPVAALLHLHCWCIKPSRFMGVSKITRSGLMRLQLLMAAGDNAIGKIIVCCFRESPSLDVKIFQTQHKDCAVSGFTILSSCKGLMQNCAPLLQLCSFLQSALSAHIPASASVF